MLTTVEVPTIDVMLYRNQQMTPEVRDAAFDIRRRSDYWELLLDYFCREIENA